MASVHAAHDGGQHRVDGNMGKGRVCEFASECRKCFGLREECARKGAKVNVLAFERKCKEKSKKCWQMCQRESKHFVGRGALEVRDIRLLEDGGERIGALLSDSVPTKTVSEWQDGKR